MRKFLVFAGRRVSLDFSLVNVFPAIDLRLAILAHQRSLVLARLELVVGTDNSLHELMPHYVGLIKVSENHALSCLQDVDGFEQAAAPCIRQPEAASG